MSYPFIKMPDGVVLDETSSSENFGRFLIKPLERGFGVTLGNAIRRVLLSSLSGSAISAIKIDGVLHEFTSIPGVVEDITDVVLNLKKVRMKLINKKTNRVELTLTGPGNFTAVDIQKNCPDIEILNPELHLATLNENAKLTMELRFGTGKGYVPAEQQVIQDQTIGIIPIDSIYTPIINVKYDVKNVRIGKFINLEFDETGESAEYEELALEVTTDGSITPEDALSSAGQILRDHVNMFINFDVEQEVDKVESEKDAETERIRKILTTSVDDLELSVRSHNCLKAANIKILGDLVRRDENEMLKFRNFGRKSLAELIEIVENYGLEFGMDVEKYLQEKSEI